MALDPTDRRTETQPGGKRRASWYWYIGGILAAAVAVFFLTGVGGDGTRHVNTDPNAVIAPGASAPPGGSVARTGIPQQQRTLPEGTGPLATGGPPPSGANAPPGGGTERAGIPAPPQPAASVPNLSGAYAPPGPGTIPAQSPPQQREVPAPR
jgi:hypothetical protein